MSIGTVSNVLNGTVGVSVERRQLVLQAVQELSYTQNLLATGLRRHRSPVVGLCVPHTSVAYFSKLVDAIEEVTSARGLQIMQVLSHENPGTELQRVSTLLSYHVGGIIIVPSASPGKALDAIARTGTPLVVVDRAVARGRFDQVTFNNRRAMDKAVRSLIMFGHRHVMFMVRLKTLATTRQRIAALMAAAKEASVKATVLECNSHDTAEIGACIVKVLQSPDRPTAIIVSNSGFAGCLLRTCEALGVRCPDNLSILAFDQPEWADLITPKLSVVRQPTAEIAYQAWECLIRRMEDESASIRTVELEAEVIVGASVGPPLGGAHGPQTGASASFGQHSFVC